VIYLDSSVVPAYLLVEDRSPHESIWRETLVSNRLLNMRSGTVFTRDGWGARTARRREP